MLPPDYLAHVADDALELYSKLDEAIIRDIVRRLVKTGRVTATAAWQSNKAQESGLLFEDVMREIAKLTDATAQQVREIFEDAGLEALAWDDKIYEAAGLTPVPLLMSPAALQVLYAGTQKTGGYLQNLTLTTAIQAQQAYIQAAALAEMKVTSGAFDYATAIREAVRSASKDGAFVRYPTGHRDRLDVAVRRAVLTGVNQTAARISLAHADEMGCDLVETTAHAGARPSHTEWQGQVFSRSGASPEYPDFVSSTGYGTGDGLCGWNCRHSFFPFYEGISRRAYTDEALEAQNRPCIGYGGKQMTVYEAAQKQRGMERAIRDTKRTLAGFDEAMKAAPNEAARNAMRIEFNAASVKLKQQEAGLRDFLNQTGLQKDGNRVQVQDFGRSQAGKAVWAAKKPSSSLENFTIYGYTGNKKRGVPVEKEFLFQKIEETVSYSADYKEKMKQTYTFFSERGFPFREHALNRFLGQKSGKGKFAFSQEELLSILREEYNYEQPDGKLTKYYNGIAVIFAPDTKEVVGIVVRAKPKSDWRAIDVKK